MPLRHWNENKDKIFYLPKDVTLPKCIKSKLNESRTKPFVRNMISRFVINHFFPKKKKLVALYAGGHTHKEQHIVSSVVSDHIKYELFLFCVLVEI